jgi:hypothetical protein
VTLCVRVHHYAGSAAGRDVLSYLQDTPVEEDAMFQANEKKATQAVAYLLQKAGGIENYTKLLKISYLVDREALIESGITVVGTRFCNMTNGPLSRDVYDYIKAAPCHEFWNKHIRKEGSYEISRFSDPGDGELSDYDIQLLDGAWEKYGAYDFREMIRIVHQLPEWKDPGSTSAVLSEEVIMEAGGVPPETVVQLQSRNTHVFLVENKLQAVGCR